MKSTMASAIEACSLSKPTMKPAVTNIPGAIDLVDAFREIAPRILLFLRRDERLRIGAFDADEDSAKKFACFASVQQFVVVGQIDRGLGRELERIAVRFRATSVNSGRNAFSAFLLPIRLSSTKSTWPR